MAGCAQVSNIIGVDNVDAFTILSQIYAKLGLVAAVSKKMHNFFFGRYNSGSLQRQSLEYLLRNLLRNRPIGLVVLTVPL